MNKSTHIYLLVFPRVLQKTPQRKSRTPLLRSWSRRSLKMCRSRSPTSTSATRMTWVFISLNMDTQTPRQHEQLVSVGAKVRLTSPPFLLFQVTNPNCPLSFGVSLKNFSLHVTSSRIFDACIILYVSALCRCLTASTLCARHRPPTRTGTPASWTRRPSFSSRYCTITVTATVTATVAVGYTWSIASLCCHCVFSTLHTYCSLSNLA